MKTAVALRHVAFEHLGTLESVLRRRGVDVRYVDTPVEAIDSIDPAEADLAVVLGGPIGAYEVDAYPFLRHELDWVESRLRSERPVLGICLGAQMIARLLGARVYPGDVKEIGWGAVTLTDAGARSCLAPLGDPDVRILHWHGDTFDLPDGAVRLAHNENYENQAFAYGRHVLGVQFHIDIRPDEIEHWLVGHAVEIATTSDVRVGDIREGAMAWAPALVAAAGDILDRWLDDAGV